MKHIALLSFAAMLAALLLSINPTTAQSGAAKSKGFDKGTDVTSSWADKAVKIVSGIKANDELKYVFGLSGETSVMNGDAAVIARTDSEVIVSAKLTKPTKGEWLDLELKYMQMSIDQLQNGRRFALFANASSTGTGDGVWVDGEKKDSSPLPGLPTASSVKSGMGTAVAYARISNANQAASRISHSARFSESAEENVPHRIFEPSALLRLLFAGFGGRETKLNQAVSFDAMLSLVTLGGAPAAYTVKLTPKAVFAKDKDAKDLSAGQFELEATPAKDAAFALSGGVNVAAPVIKGTALIDLARGVIVRADLSAALSGESAGNKISGSVKITVDVPKEQ